MYSIDYFKKIPTYELFELKKKCDELYFNVNTDQISPLTDDEYDFLIVELESRLHHQISNVGISPNINKIQLPVYMSSLNKIKNNEENKFKNWFQKYNFNEYLIEPKLDGVSILIVYTKNELQPKLYTRGNGFIGSDISHLYSQLQLPQIDIQDDNVQNLIIRGELIMKKETFKEFYSDKFSNPRNLVSGMINSIQPDLQNNVDCVVFQLLSPIISDYTPLENLKYLETLNFNVILNQLISKPDIQNLTKKIIELKESLPYEIDGLVLQPNRVFEIIKNENPKNIIAFKILQTENIRQTTVKKVIWNVTQFGILKPKLEVEPVEINGVIITYATAYHAKYIYNNNIGPGTIITITRSGDVIPYIVSIISCTIAQMPDVKYKWDVNNVNIQLISDDDEEIKKKQILSFFTIMNILYISSQTIDKMFAKGFNDLFKILNMSLNNYYMLDGFKENGKMAEKIRSEIHTKLKHRSLQKILTASSSLGYGISEKRIELLLTEIPDLLDEKYDIQHELLKNIIKNIKGFGIKMAETIVQNLVSAREFVYNFHKLFPPEEEKEEEEKEVNENEESHEKEKTLLGLKVVFSGVRDKNLEKEIIENGGIVKDVITKDVKLLIVEDITQITSKVKKAQSYNIPIIIKKDFKNQYLMN